MAFNINPDSPLGTDDETKIFRDFWKRGNKTVLSRTTSLPGSPAAGNRYIVPSADPLGNQIAFYYDADWHMLMPTEGWEAYVEDSNEKVLFNGSAWTVIAGATITNTRVIAFVIDGGGAPITTGVKGDVHIPFACTIQEATLLADQTGSIVVDIWKDTYTAYPPTVADSITASAKPTLSSAIKSTNTTLTGWTTAIPADSTLRYNVDSVSTVTRVTVSLKVST